MDSVTQIALGAAVGEAVLGRQLGNRAILWGAAFGTLPDLDIVLTPFQDSVQFLVHHRGLSHSLLAVAVVSPLLAHLFTRWYGGHDPPISYRRWAMFFLLVFLTHILLDCCTSYGTQIFAPFSDRRVAWNNVFIIDPLYTTPLLLGLIVCLFLHRTGRARRVINTLGLVLSTGYLAFTMVAKQHVDDVIAVALAEQQIAAERFMTSPTPLNSVLWYAVAEEADGYHVGYYSLFDSTADVDFRFAPRCDDLLGELADDYGVDRLIWFADGYYCVRPHEDGLLLHVMKFGRLSFLDDEGQYPFTYLIRTTDNPGSAIERYETSGEIDARKFGERLWSRLKGN